MKSVFAIVIACLVLFLTSNLQAVTISDNYYGGAAGYVDIPFDIIADQNEEFDIDRAELSVSGNILTVDIYSRYFDNIGSAGTELGDLFISTDGWKPVGTPNYGNDYFGVGGEEDWEYALVLDDHLGTKGNVGLYEVENDRIITADELTDDLTDGTPVGRPAGVHPDQEVLYGTIGINTAIFGEWEIFSGAADTDTDDYLRFVIDVSSMKDFDISNLGIHWSMTCANDVLEGGTSEVPEPMSMVLFGLGMLGLAGSSIRKRRKS